MILLWKSKLISQFLNSILSQLVYFLDSFGQFLNQFFKVSQFGKLFEQITLRCISESLKSSLCVWQALLELLQLLKELIVQFKFFFQF